MSETAIENPLSYLPEYIANRKKELSVNVDCDYPLNITSKLLRENVNPLLTACDYQKLVIEWKIAPWKYPESDILKNMTKLQVLTTTEIMLAINASHNISQSYINNILQNIK